MEMWKCSRCDTKNQDNMKFCQVCHAPRPADEPKQEPEKKKKTVPRSAVPDQPEKKPEPSDFFPKSSVPSSAGFYRKYPKTIRPTVNC